MPTDVLLAMIGFAFVASVTPGPNNVMLLASGVNFGLRRSVPHMLGITVGFTVMLLALGVGAARAFDLWPQLHVALKLASLVYMLWLAWKIASAAPVSAGSANSPSRPMSFLGAGLFQWVNPKAWAIMLTGVSAYTGLGDSTTRLLVLAAVFAAVNLISSTLWTGFGVGVRRLLQDHWKVRLFNWLMAVLLLASLVPVVQELLAIAIWTSMPSFAP